MNISEAMKEQGIEPLSPFDNKTNIAEGSTEAPKRIGSAEVREANVILEKYKGEKKNLENRIISNEQWYRMRHWEELRKGEKKEVEPTSAWLFNSIANKHADAMDNFPAPNILPREEGDKEEAKKLSSIVPVILEQNDFEKTYSDMWYRKLIGGTGVCAVLWDKRKLNGLGDVSIKKVDVLNLFWEGGVEDIQDSQNFFSVELASKDVIKAMYPKLDESPRSASDVASYTMDEDIDASEKVAVVDWYYKKRAGNRIVLHYCKYVGETVLYASENEEEYAERGWYDHGLYPFVFDPLFPVVGSPCGFSYIDVGKDCQGYIDRGNQAILDNMLANASPRYFSNIDGAVNEGEFTDLSKKIVHTDGTLGEDSLRQIPAYPLSDIYVSVINNKVDELKETTGNRDISNGGTTSGVTAASAIAAMQEAGSKLSRDMNKAAYRSFRKICMFVIELIRQFYDAPRCFRITGENGAEEFARISNTNIIPQKQETVAGEDMGYRLPVFDIEVTAQKASPYSKMAQNELALQFFGFGFFNPQIADQALACLEMMDFDRKSMVANIISRNGTMYQQLQQMQQQMLALAKMVDAYSGKGPAITNQLAAQFGMSGVESAPIAVPEEAPRTEVLGRELHVENGNVKKARQRVADSTSPT